MANLRWRIVFSTFLAWSGLAALAPTGAVAQDIIPPKSYTVTPSGVNVADGSLQHSVTDLSVGSMELVRILRIARPSGVSGPKQPNDPPFGKNFTNNFDIYVSGRPDTIPGSFIRIVVHTGGSASGNYKQLKTTLSTIYEDNLDAEKGLLQWTGPNNLTSGKYVYTDSSGTVYTFSSTVTVTGAPFSTYSRRVESILYADGRRRSFSYTAGNALKLVEDSSGYAIVFDLDGNGDITAACAFNRSVTYVSTSSTCAGAQVKTSYAYTSLYLTSATSTLGNVTIYTNASTGPFCIKPPGAAACQVTMNGGVQTLVDGAQWTVTGDNPDIINNPDQNPPGDGTNEVGVTDPLGKQILLNFTKTSPYTLTDANGAVTQYRYEGAVSFDYTGAYYHDGTLLMQAILPEGNVYAAQYNGPFRAVTQETMTPKPGSDLQVITKTYGYASTASLQSRAKPIIVTDPKGNVSNYTYATHGGVLSELRPLATLTDASGAVQARPLKLTTWAQRYAWIKNSVGALVQAATPVWVTATESQCQAVPGSNTPTCDAGKQQTLTTYQYGATGTGESLLVKGVAVSSGGVTLRTCYTYDALARKVSETKPNANLGVCP